MVKILSKITMLSIGALFFSNAYGQVTILGNGLQPSNVSNTGAVVGSFQNSSFLWTPDNGLQNMGDISNGSSYSGDADITADGTKAAFTSTNPATNLNEFTLYDIATKTPTYLGGGSDAFEGTTGSAFAMSNNGNYIVGRGYKGALAVSTPIKWENGTGITELQTNSPQGGGANSISIDGNVIGGFLNSQFGEMMGSVWKNGVPTLITDNDGMPMTYVTKVSDDGNWAIANSYDQSAVIWSETAGATKIPPINVTTDMYTGYPTGINANGSIVVGYYRDAFSPSFDTNESFIWTRSGGSVLLSQYVTSLGLDTQGVNFILPTDISPNGKYITGWGMKDGKLLGFRIELPATTQNCSQGNVTIAAEEGNPITDMNQTIADDFVVAAGKKMTINQVKIKTVNVGGSLSQLAFNFYKDNAGLPGDAVAAVNAITPTSMTQVDTYYGYPVYEVVADLPTPVVLNEGTYWLSPVGTGSNVYWGTTSINTGGSKTVLKSGSSAWGYTALGAAYSIFEVSGSCEAVSTMNVSDIKSSKVSYYPNPVKDVLTIASDKKIKDILIYNTAGQLVLTTDKLVDGQINVSALRSGVYLCSVNLTDGEVKTFRVIKK